MLRTKSGRPGRLFLPLILLITALPCRSQVAAEKLEFEVASVRENRSEEKPHSNFSLDSGNVFSTVSKDDLFVPAGGYFSATNMRLLTYVGFAYGLTGTQYLQMRFDGFAGASAKLPGWVKETNYDIQARAAEGTTRDQMRRMMQALLKDRFKLEVHRETRQVQVLALTMVQAGGAGPHLRPHAAEDACVGDAPGPGGLPPVCGVIAHLTPSAPGRSRIGGRNISLGLLASSLPTQTGMYTLPHPVIDETGLSGGFDFELEWTPVIVGEATPEPDVSGMSFTEALKKQLGLKVVPKTGPVEVLVIDHVEQPSANE